MANKGENMGISYKNMKILAPMVRIGGLPMRLLALKYGADLVYCEVVASPKVIASCYSRLPTLAPIASLGQAQVVWLYIKQNMFLQPLLHAVLESIDFVHPDGNVVFRTCEMERGKVVFQMGTSDPGRALQTAKMVEGDVAAIDVNMGCPKDYSIKGGMGAALLKTPEKVKNILTALVQGIPKPVTCKIRILPTLEETLNLVRMIQDTKVAAVAVHGREQHERPRDPVHKDVIREVARTLNIPVICNGGSGEIKTYQDMERYQNETETDSVMVARAAQWNPSVFRKEGPLPIQKVIEDFIKFAVKYDNSFSNTKYCLAQMMHEELETPHGAKLISSKTMKEICDIWGLGSYFKACEEERRSRTEMIKNKATNGFAGKRKRDDDVNEMEVTYNRKLYGNMTPKCVLFDWTRKNELKQPFYESVENAERIFKSVVTVNGEKYTSLSGDKSKKSAEQLAALVCLNYLGIDDGKLKI